MNTRIKSSKSRLTPRQASLFPGDTLFEKIARTVCGIGMLPAKELFETWETARRIRRKFRAGRIVDVACGHGLLSHIMLLLDNSSPGALCIDTNFPPSAGRLFEEMRETWPKLEGRIQYAETNLEEVILEPGDLVVSIHACGGLTDVILEEAIHAKARVAVLPCCQDVGRSDTGGLTGWLDGPLAVDVMRASRLGAAGYTVFTRTIPADITPKNRLLMGCPGTE
jgi:hypothetical protein